MVLQSGEMLFLLTQEGVWAVAESVSARAAAETRIVLECMSNMLKKTMQFMHFPSKRKVL